MNNNTTDTRKSQCYYCERSTKGRRTEQDHWPVPARHGGTATVTACIDCHDRKDRYSLGHWDANEAVAAMNGLWNKANGDERILISKMYALLCDLSADNERRD